MIPRALFPIPQFLPALCRGINKERKASMTTNKDNIGTEIINLIAGAITADDLTIESETFEFTEHGKRRAQLALIQRLIGPEGGTFWALVASELCPTSKSPAPVEEPVAPPVAPPRLSAMDPDRYYPGFRL